MSSTPRTIFLSYPLSATTPGFGGHLHFEVQSRKSLACGDSCNQQIWTIDNHTGTHLDAPLHFFDGGKSVDSYDADDWVFRNVGICDIDAENGQIIDARDLNLEKISGDIELLLIRTGFEQKRSVPDYWNSNPGLAPALAETLRRQFPKLRAVGFDFISLTSFLDKPTGRLAHQAFLAPERPLIIIEDMKLGELKAAPVDVIVSPLRVLGADGAPCTVFARL